MNKNEIDSMVLEIEKEDSLFSKKAYLDTLAFPANIVGRQDKAKQLVRFLLGYKQGYVVPLISVYGRSGSGKSTIVKFVCENLKDISYCFVNLRKAKTVFGAANQILGQLGESNLKSAQGLGFAVENIGNKIESILKQEGKNLFVLVLDEYDVLFYDKRGKPSDFIFKLISLEENLRAKEYLLCVVTISNNVLSDYELEDRVRSRIGSSEIFFEPYVKDDVFEILKERAAQAFSGKIDEKVLLHCANLSSQEHGDARRAVDLLRVAAELASSQNKEITESHIDMASEQLQKDRIEKVLSSASYHLKLACTSLARVTFLTGEPWHATSTLYKQYRVISSKDTKPLGYRRVSELLSELENTGLVVSQTSSKGRHGYGTQYKLTVSPEMIGMACFPKWWEDVVRRKLAYDAGSTRSKVSSRSSFADRFGSILAEQTKKDWNEFVGL